MADRKTRGRTQSAPAEVTPTPVEASPTVALTVQIPVGFEVAIADGVTFRVDAARLAQCPAALAHVVKYGLSRFTRDGTTKIASGEKDAEGKALLRDATPAERVTLAGEKWARLFEGRMRERGTATADPVLGEYRTLAVRLLVKSGVARKAIPKLPDYAAIDAALKAHSGAAEKLRKRAAAIAAMRDEE